MASQADLDAIDAEIATIRAVKQTTIDNQSTTFRDMKDLYAERKRIVDALAAASGRSSTRYAAFTKGV